MKQLITLIIAVLLFSGCQHPASASLSSKSPDGNTAISVNAKKDVALDPFIVILAVQSAGKEIGSLQFEIAAAELNNTNVKFAWADDRNCRITFVQTDGGERIFAYYATNTNIIVKEIKNE